MVSLVEEFLEQKVSPRLGHFKGPALLRYIAGMQTHFQHKLLAFEDSTFVFSIYY